MNKPSDRAILKMVEELEASEGHLKHELAIGEDYMHQRDVALAQLDAVRDLPRKWRIQTTKPNMDEMDCADELQAALKAEAQPESETRTSLPKIGKTKLQLIADLKTKNKRIAVLEAQTDSVRDCQTYVVELDDCEQEWFKKADILEAIGDK